MTAGERDTATPPKTKTASRRMGIPLYEQVKRRIAADVSRGAWKTGEKLPSENEIAAELSVSRLTAHRALRELAAEGLIRRVHGVGSFVARSAVPFSIVRVHDIADVIRSRGDELSATVVETGETRAGPELGRSFGVPSRATLFRSVVVYRANGVPLQIETRHVSPAFAPDYPKQDFREISTTDYLRSVATPTRASNVIEATSPTPEEARLLEIAPSEPCLSVLRSTWVGDRMTTFTLLVHPGCRYRLSSDQFDAADPEGSET